jgi:hypothetical protein
VEDGDRVGNVDDVCIRGDLRDKIAGVEVVADRHAETQREGVFVLRRQLVHKALGETVEAADVVRGIRLDKRRAADWVCLVVVVDAPVSTAIAMDPQACSKNCAQE